MALVELNRFYNGLEAGIVRSRLQSDGIESVLFDTAMNWGGLDGIVIPVRLMVDEDDLAQAKRILAECQTDPR
jgi:hypothetical protein